MVCVLAAGGFSFSSSAAGKGEWFTSGWLGTSREMSRRREQTLFFPLDSVSFVRRISVDQVLLLLPRRMW